MRAGLLIVAVLALGVAAAALYRSRHVAPPSRALTETGPDLRSPRSESPPAASVSVPAAKPTVTEELRKDPLIDQWYRSIQRRDAPGVVDLQMALLHREEESRAVLERIAQEEPDARVRAFSVTVLSRFKTPPAGPFFMRRLEDLDFGPRLAALAALEKLGVRESLPAVERLASGDPHEEVRAAAAKTAAALRAK